MDSKGHLLPMDDFPVGWAPPSWDQYHAKNSLLVRFLSVASIGIFNSKWLKQKQNLLFHRVRSLGEGGSVCSLGLP